MISRRLFIEEKSNPFSSRKARKIYQDTNSTNPEADFSKRDPKSSLVSHEI